MSKELSKRLSEIQKTLKVEKGQLNKFGGYSYRSSEDILEAVKKILKDGETITVDEDMIVLSGEGQARFYKKSIATFSDGENSISKSAFTREDENQKGMASAQLSGSVGSYGKKYALGNLLAIDDTKDADATNDHGKKEPAKSSTRKSAAKKEEKKEEKPSRRSAKKEEKPAEKEPEDKGSEDASKSGGSFRRRRR